MQEDFNVWPPPPKGQAPPQPSPPIRLPVPPAIRRQGREALILVLLSVTDLVLVVTGTLKSVFFYSNISNSPASTPFWSQDDFWFCAACPLLLLGLYKGWRGWDTWAGRLAIAIAGGILLPYVPLFIITMHDALK